MRTLVIALIFVACDVGSGSVTTKNAGEGSIESRNTDIEWTAEDMPDPRYCPDCCGIEEQGWICDPDGVFKDRALGGGPNAVDLLNSDLWVAANHSFCPCSLEDCDIHNVIILVAVVKKLKNPDGKPKNELVASFAKELQEQWWKADDSGCQKEIVIAVSINDQAITTEIGDDVLESEMMTYDDVVLVGGSSPSFHPSYDLFSTIKFLISAYGLYIDHPPPGMLAYDGTTNNDGDAPDGRNMVTRNLEKAAQANTTESAKVTTTTAEIITTTSAGSFPSSIAAVTIISLLVALLVSP